MIDSKLSLVLTYLFFIVIGLSIGYFIFIPIVESTVLGLTIGLSIGMIFSFVIDKAPKKS